jgi:hypothetical protein
MKEVIQHKENGLLFTALNSDSAHSQIMHLKDMSPSERREMADKGKRQVEQQHAIRSMQEGFTEMYKSVI